jgi:high-affinity iron transporter
VRRVAAAALGVVAVVAMATTPNAAAADAPWRSADALRGGLFDAQTALILETPRAAALDVRRATRRYRGELRRNIARSAPAADRALRRALAAAHRAAARGNATALAAARGTARAALLLGAYAVTLDATGRGDAATARRWLLLREFRTATRFTRPGADGTLAVDRLAAHRLSPRAARQIVAKDLLDAYQARLRELLADAQRGEQRGLPVRRAEAAAQAAGYFEILAPRYTQDRGGAATKRARAVFHAKDPAAALAALRGFTAAPFTPAEAQRRAQQLLRFLSLVPVEYGRGVSGTEVSKAFEIQEAVAFSQGASAALDDLRDQMAKRDPARTAAAARGLASIGAIVDNATRNPKHVAEHDDLQQLTDRTDTAMEAAMPDAWLKETEASDYDLIDITLDRMQAAAGAGEWGQAERARLEAYAFFEFGPERRLKAFDPALGLKLENLIWYGSGGVDGLARLIADKRPVRDLRETRRVVDEQLSDAAATLGDSASRAGVVVNSAILVFREGLEAVLILAAITASFVGVRRRLRRPVFIGSLLGWCCRS